MIKKLYVKCNERIVGTLNNLNKEKCMEIILKVDSCVNLMLSKYICK